MERWTLALRIFTRGATSPQRIGYIKMLTIVKELAVLDKPAIEAHFLALAHDERRLRFGTDLSESAIRSYVNKIDFSNDAVFGVLESDLSIIGVAHLARDDDCAELGLSVLASHRNRGIATELLRRANIHARNWGATTLYMHYLTQNNPISRIARREGMLVVTDATEADARISLIPADAQSRTDEATEQRIALVDYVLKTKQLKSLRNAS